MPCIPPTRGPSSMADPLAALYIPYCIFILRHYLSYTISFHPRCYISSIMFQRHLQLRIKVPFHWIRQNLVVGSTITESTRPSRIHLHPALTLPSYYKRSTLAPCAFVSLPPWGTGKSASHLRVECERLRVTCEQVDNTCESLACNFEGLAST